MRISRVETIPIALPFRERYLTASGELAARAMVVIRIHADNGEIGLGEAVPLNLRGGPTLGSVAAELDGICARALAGVDAGPLLTSIPAEIRRWSWEVLARCRSLGAGPQAVAAVDIALHDLAGRLCGLPVWRLLGAPAAREITCNATLDAREPVPAGVLAGRQAAAGFHTFKVKVGTGDDLERSAAGRAAIPRDAHIRIDANGAWSVDQATSILTRLLPHGIELAEQPSMGLEALREVRARTPVPVVADESVASVADAQAASSARACDAATIKLAKVGGPLEAIRIAAVLPAYLSSALDGPIGIAAAAHTAQVLPEDGFASGLAHGLATLDMFEATYAPTTGLTGPTLHPPRAPGLGVEIDEAALERLRLR
jgi:L-alanine-DL-glutamate epimerase-like enolase superfamily enzyme